MELVLKFNESCLILLEHMDVLKYGLKGIKPRNHEWYSKHSKETMAKAFAYKTLYTPKENMVH